MNTLRQGTFRRWTLWSLVMAWLCANGPQAAVYEAVLWVREAAQFTHQATLKEQVAAALAGRERPSRAARLAATPLPAKPVAEKVPAEAVLKKTDLGWVEIEASTLHGVPEEQWIRVTAVLPPARVSDVPRTPPRSA
ncbi:MAG: hypothetical protein U1F61_15530 [Opitutaceae bacterium]